MDILARIAPTKLSEIVGNRAAVRRFQEALKAAATPILAVTGPSGCGKTLLCNLGLEGYEIHAVSKDNYNAKEALQSMRSFCINRTMDSFLNKQSRKVLYLDDVDVLMAQDRCIVSNLQALVPIARKCGVQIVMACHLHEERRLQDFKKDIEVISLTYPPVKDAYCYLLAMDLPVDAEVLLRAVQHYRGNIRDTLLNIELPVDKADKTAAFKDLTSFQVVSKVFAEGPKANCDALHAVEDIGLLGFLLYENMPEELYLNRKARTLAGYLRLNDHFGATCMLENVGMMDLVHDIRLGAILGELGQATPPKSPAFYKYRFSQALSKVSHRNMMKKKLTTLQEVHGLTPDNLFWMVDICVSKKIPQKTGTEWSSIVTTYGKYFS